MTAPRLAALPMYDFADMQKANDAYWHALANRLHQRGLTGIPSTLTRGNDLYGIWQDPSLLLAQTCGYPLTHALAGRVRLVATPIYAAEGCDGPLGRSVILVRNTSKAATLQDLRGRTCAVNAADSNSGMNLLRARLARLAPVAEAAPFFHRILITGAHLESLRAIAAGEADTAAVDCVTWAHSRRHLPWLTRRLRVLDWTLPAPWLPLITARQTPEHERAVLRAELRPDPHLLIEGYALLNETAYATIPELERDAATRGFSSISALAKSVVDLRKPA